MGSRVPDDAAVALAKPVVGNAALVDNKDVKGAEVGRGKLDGEGTDRDGLIGKELSEVEAESGGNTLEKVEVEGGATIGVVFELELRHAIV